MKKEIKKSLLIIIASVLIFGVLGYVIGELYFRYTLITFGFVGTQEQLKNFCIAGFIHDFEYLGGIIGLLFTVYFQIINKKQSYTHHQTP